MAWPATPTWAPLARSIADLAGAAQIGPAHLAEALQYRPKVVGM